MPNIEENSCPIAFGDFYAGYTVIESRDFYFIEAENKVKYVKRKFYGKVTDFNAIKLLQWIILITFEEEDKYSGKLETYVSHGVNMHSGKTIILPNERLSNFKAKFSPSIGE